MRTWLGLGSIVLLACGAPEPMCERVVGAHTSAASAPDRRLLGAAAEYPADPALEARHAELVASQRARRAAAWQAVARVLAPTPLAEPTPVADTRVPRFRGFYDSEDYQRLFQHLYGGLTPEERAAGARFSRARLDEAFAWNVGFLDELGTWPEERWAEHVASFETHEDVNAIGGIRRISMSPGMTAHLMNSYPEVRRCVAEGAPPPEVAGELRTDRLLRAPVELSACGEARFGPFAVVEGGSLRVTFDGAGDARVLVLLDDEVRCEADACTVEGPGAFSVRVLSAEEPTSGVVEVERTQEVPPVACLNGPLPIDAVSIAAEWRRLDPALPLPTFDTSADALAALLREPTPTWGDGDGTASPGPDSIYTQHLPTNATFVLAGFHVRTRELPLGLNITLWWSDRPDDDFGADRPDAIRALGPPWSSYKMCVTVDHAELDPDPEGGFGDELPSLGAALAAVHEGTGGPTWCSNPYVDAAPGLARGNCIGCHQHAMSGARPGEVATDEARFPSSGRLAARNNYPADGFWGLDAGDGLAGLMQNVIDYFQ